MIAEKRKLEIIQDCMMEIRNCLGVVKGNKSMARHLTNKCEELAKTNEEFHYAKNTFLAIIKSHIHLIKSGNAAQAYYDEITRKSAQA